MSGHTPGPWQAEKSKFGDWSVGTDDADIADINGFGGEEEDESDANARLIAAAPDGLEAAELAYLALLQLPLTSPHRLAAQMAMARLRDFIAKATGRESEEVQNDYEDRVAKAAQP